MGTKASGVTSREIGAAEVAPVGARETGVSKYLWQNLTRSG